MNSPLGHLRRKYARLRHFVRYPSIQLDTITMLIAEERVAAIRTLGRVEDMLSVEFRAFSQFGEDGIIQYLIHRIPVPHGTFIEFGVGDYTEANTRYLLKHDNWRGLVIDGDQGNVDVIRDDRVSVYHDLSSVCAFVTAGNINGLIAGAGIGGDIGLMSIDIDGNDYWIWKAIDVVSPRIIVCEYNSLFGPDAAVTVPYDPAFDYNSAHHTRLYFGASLAAFCSLAKEKGYEFAGSTSAGNDAFFVRKDVAHHVKTFTAREGFVDCRFRDSRGPGGEKTFLAGKERIRSIRHLPVIDVATGGVKTIGEALGENFFA